MGALWWSGRGLGGVSEGAAGPVTFQVHNQGGTPMRLQAVFGGQPFKATVRPQGDGEHVLLLPENTWCPTPCPGQGPVPEHDCARPPEVSLQLQPGEKAESTWEGLELVTRVRACDGGLGAYCQEAVASLPGAYTVEICGVPVAQEDGAPPLAGTAPDGGSEPVCGAVDFALPAAGPVVLGLGG